MYKPHSNQAGNALIAIMIAIFLVGLLAKNMIEKDIDTSYVADDAAARAASAELLAHEINLKIAIQTIINNGVDGADIDDMDPADPDFETAPHMAKVYHPFGGGVQYQQDYAGWNNIQINVNTSIESVGPTAANDIVAIGDVSEDLCDDLSESPATVVSQPAIDALHADTAITLSDGSTCSSGACDGIVRQCVRNSGGTEFIFYSVLHAQ